MAATYLPLLLAANAATPDDSSVTTLPTSQVDYLSHEWREEDVWSSWRSMTRQKNAIANGTRLENASWRTWWKQRNKLKTISPKTLNWLKDSDVTWLYGPLHPGVDWDPLAKSTDDPNEISGSPSYGSPSVGSPYTKPILKHRSIGEILSLPPAPFPDADDDAGVVISKDVNFLLPPESSEKPPSSRPPLLHTKSETHIARHVMPQFFRKDSPPRIFSNPCPGSSSSPDEIASNDTSTGSEQDLAPAGAQTGKKKHISFNTFVEQCIAIEKPKIKRSNNNSKPRFTVVEFDDDDGYDEDSEMGYDESEEPSAPPSATFYRSYEADSDSDSDDILEMTTSSSRSRSSSSSRSVTGNPYYPPSRRPSSEQYSSLIGEEHRTIAYIAPTILKTTGVGNNVPIYGYEPGQALTGVELVYVPPIKGNLNGPRYGPMSGASIGGNVEVYPQQADDYFGSHGSGSQTSSSFETNPKIPSAGFLPNSGSSAFKEDITEERLNWNDDFSESIIHSDPIGIPLEMEENDIVGEDDAFDCLVGPDLGEDFSGKRSREPRNSSVEDQRAVEVLKYAQGGAASVVGGRCPKPDETDVSMPIPVLISRPHAEQISPSKALYISSPSSNIDIDHPVYSEHSPIMTSQLLCPPDVPPTRGRMSPSSTPSVGGSTTSPSTSHSRSSDSRSESRGRSSTRNSSYSDRERSGSRSSRSTNSPLGSVSPSGSVIGIGGQYSNRDGRIVAAGGGSCGRERGRERIGRKLSGSLSSSPSSLSPPNPASPTRGGSSDYQPYHPTQSELYSSLSGSMADSISSSGSNSSTAGPNSQSSSSESTVTGVVNIEERVYPIHGGSRNHRGISLPIPSPILEEDEQRSRHPTPASSPITAMRPALPIAPPHMSSPGVTICTTPPTPEKSNVSVTSSWDYLDEPPVGTLVGRAVEIVSSARGLLGSFWPTSPS